MPKLIHAATIYAPDGKKTLYLREKEPKLYTWFLIKPDGSEEETGLSADTIEEAIRLAAREWKNHEFNTLLCGYRFILPERDEHGMNALFYQMAQALTTINGVYFDNELGHYCAIRQVPQAAKDLYDELKRLNRL